MCNLSLARMTVGKTVVLRTAAATPAAVDLRLTRAFAAPPPPSCQAIYGGGSYYYPFNFTYTSSTHVHARERCSAFSSSLLSTPHNKIHRRNDQRVLFVRNESIATRTITPRPNVYLILGSELPPTDGGFEVHPSEHDTTFDYSPKSGGEGLLSSKGVIGVDITCC